MSLKVSYILFFPHSTFFYHPNDMLHFSADHLSQCKKKRTHKIFIILRMKPSDWLQRSKNELTSCLDCGQFGLRQLDSEIRSLLHSLMENWLYGRSSKTEDFCRDLEELVALLIRTDWEGLTKKVWHSPFRQTRRICFY